MDIARHSELQPYVTKDGSTIREWMGPDSSAHNQSLAEATVPPGGVTAAHFHRSSEELYRGVLREAPRDQIGGSLGQLSRERVAGAGEELDPGPGEALREQLGVAWRDDDVLSAVPDQDR